jgi:hypothetical protein
MLKMLREPEVLAKMAMGRTKFNLDYIKTGRARWIRTGRIKRMPEHDVDRLIQEDINAAPSPVRPAVPRGRSRRSGRSR